MTTDREERSAIDWRTLLSLISFSRPDKLFIPSEGKKNHRPWETALNQTTVRQKIQDFLGCELESLALEPDRIVFDNLIGLLKLAQGLGIEMDLWKSQSTFYELYKDTGFVNALSMEHAAMFRQLGLLLGFVMEGE